ncbi:MAG: type II toxin-antitoxin system RelE/ParE family toxin [Nanoarchaeota archaeon]
MVKVVFTAEFKRTFSKIKDNLTKEKVIKQIEKISKYPETGKPMRFNRKGTREVYSGSFRLSYSYNSAEDTLYLLAFYHKDEQ